MSESDIPKVWYVKPRPHLDGVDVVSRTPLPPPAFRVVSIHDFTKAVRLMMAMHTAATKGSWINSTGLVEDVEALRSIAERMIAVIESQLAGADMSGSMNSILEEWRGLYGERSK